MKKDRSRSQTLRTTLATTTEKTGKIHIEAQEQTGAAESDDSVMEVGYNDSAGR